MNREDALVFLNKRVEFGRLLNGQVIASNGLLVNVTDCSIHLNYNGSAQVYVLEDIRWMKEKISI